MKNTTALDNDGKHLSEVLNKAACKKHNAGLGIPCFHTPKNSFGQSGYYAAACGSRIRKAGYVGTISHESMRSKAPTKKTDGDRKSFGRKSTLNK